MIDINPVKSTLKNNPGAGIQTLNNDCYSICDSYEKIQNVGSCKKLCNDMLNNFKRKKGQDVCSQQVPYPPVSWHNNIRYFPGLLEKIENPDQALSKCKEICISKAPNTITNECIRGCELDYDAVELSPEDSMRNLLARKLGNKQRNNQNNSKDSETGIGDVWIALMVALVVVFVVIIIKNSKM